MFFLCKVMGDDTGGSIGGIERTRVIFEAPGQQ